ncbi:ATP-binding protein [Pelobacter propionicus]|uniref:histidine kinase n=1 Tax=Pelobacter propionicus (strain DSM 2379 / NBRC 103807 / OttBd1) TaxID=338966 RepID=A1AK61_PELPD|nr:ATP-binding protein [Pelobacter propionicus]ABK97731.1 PAS/PAC sensor signal transduction histidine kinase [Pelobacter propionicus DSM 2379]
MNWRPRKRNSLGSYLLLAALICAGFAGNFFAPPLYLGFGYLFGSIFVLMVLRLFGIGWGVLAGLVASSATIHTFGHPYAMAWLCAEPLFVGWLLVKGRTRNIILFDAVYWPLVGAPLIWFFFRFVMQVDAAVSLAAMLLFWITGITNALLASLLQTHLPSLARFAVPESRHLVPIHQLIFNVLMAAVLIPAVVILVIHGRSVESSALRDLECDLEKSLRAGVHGVGLRLHGQGASAEELRRILLAARHKPFNRLTLVDGEGRVIVATDDGGPGRGELFRGCPEDVPSSGGNGGLAHCTDEVSSAQLPGERHRSTIFSISMEVGQGSRRRMIAETSFAPYQPLLVSQCTGALALALGLNMLALAIAMYTSRRLAAPLMHLSRITTDLPERILDGTDAPLPESTVAEIDRLSSNFRAMSNALADRFQEITLYSETLETRVRERTRELIRANDKLERENVERTQTEQQRDQLLDELVNQLRFLQKIIDAIPNPIFYRDLNGVYQGCNRAFEENWGLSREEIVGKTVRDLFPEETVRMLQSSDRDSLGKLGAEVIESQLCYADGKNHEVIIYTSTYDDTKGNPAGVVGSVVDITLRKNAEAERDRLVVELQQKNKELEGIVYVASHDLRSPLVNIQGFSRKLLKSCGELESLLAGEMDDEQRRRLEWILKESIPKSLGFVTGSVEKMDAILKGLLRLSRLGRAALCFDTLDMQSIMEKIADSMAYQIDTAGARVEIQRLGPCVADAGQISQVFSNLLDNAIKYRSPDRPLHVRISSQEFEEGIRYCVEDNGIGIPRDQQEAIWEIFHRLDPDSCQGEGLGLTLARRIVARLGGSIWVESTEGEGSCFYVVLRKPAQQV